MKVVQCKKTRDIKTKQKAVISHKEKKYSSVSFLMFISKSQLHRMVPDVFSTQISTIWQKKKNVTCVSKSFWGFLYLNFSKSILRLTARFLDFRCSFKRDATYSVLIPLTVGIIKVTLIFGYTKYFLNILNPFIPEFLKWSLPFLNLGLSTDANRGFSLK